MDLSRLKLGLKSGLCFKAEGRAGAKAAVQLYSGGEAAVPSYFASESFDTLKLCLIKVEK